MILVFIRAMTIQRRDITKRYLLMALVAAIHLRKHSGGQRLLSIVQALHHIDVVFTEERFRLTGFNTFRRRDVIVSCIRSQVRVFHCGSNAASTIRVTHYAHRIPFSKFIERIVWVTIRQLL